MNLVRPILHLRKRVAKPLDGFCFIRPEFHPKQIGLIHLPQNLGYRKLPDTGEVVSVTGEAEFKVGDRVFYNNKSCDLEHVKDENGKPLARVKVGDVMAIL